MTALDLVRRVEANEEVHVLDVRAPFRLESGRIEVVPDERFHNIPGSQLVALRDPETAGIPRGKPVVVVCGRGNDSLRLAAFLNRSGYRSLSLAGGMRSWMELIVPRELAPPPGADALVQCDRIGKGALGYVLVSGGEALVIDPARHLEPYRRIARQAGARITAVAETHVHADYVSGGPALAREEGAAYFLHPADAVYPYDGTPGRLDFTPVGDGHEIVAGDIRLRVMHTPGHTEGSVCYLAGDSVAFTGDFLFVGSMGRPDLGGKAEEWTGALWDSLQRARAEWPAGLRVLPAHYAEASERETDGRVDRPFGALAAGNRPLSLVDRDAFAAWVLGRTGVFPEAYRRIKAVNVGLAAPGADELEELEAGKNQCALG